MTPLSTRFAVPALALLLAAAAPVWVRALAEPAGDECGDSLSLDAVLALPGTVAARNLAPGAPPDRSHWIEGEIAAPAGDVSPLRFRFVRTSEPALLYFEPLSFFSRNAAPDALRGIRWLDAGAERLPVHWRYDTVGEVYVIEYLLAQDGRPVRHPLLAGLATAAAHVWRGARPVTLLLVDGVGPPGRRDAIERAAEAWLLTAWQRYSAGCRG